MHFVALSAALLTILVVFAVGMMDAAVTGDTVAEKDQLDGSSGKYVFTLFILCGLAYSKNPQNRNQFFQNSLFSFL